MIKHMLLLLTCYQACLTGLAHDQSMVVDSSKMDVVGEFEGPTAIAVNGSYAYVCNLVGRSVQVIDVASNAVVSTIKDLTMDAPFKISIVNNYAYVCNVTRNTLSIIDTTTNTFVTTISDGIRASGGITSASVLGTPLAFIVDAGVLQVLNLSSPKHPVVVQTFFDDQINGLGIGISDGPDYSIYITASAGENQGQILSYHQMSGLYSSIPVSIAPPDAEEGRLLTAITIVGNSYAYVCDQLNNIVQVYDLEHECYLTKVEGFDNPTALANNGTDIYVCSFGGAPLPKLFAKTDQKSKKDHVTVSIINANNHKIRGNLTGSYSPQAIATVPGTSDTFYIIRVRRSSTGSSTGEVSKGSFNSNDAFSSHGVF